MYEEFYGLRERPFGLTPNPRFLFLNPCHREALATMRYGLRSSLGITLLLGEAGTGKTTLLRAALQAERRAADRYAVLNNPMLTASDFFQLLAAKFCLPALAGSKAGFLMAFEKELMCRRKAGGGAAIVVDEAQSLSHELFEEIRLLANLETTTAKLVNVVLVGQPELADRLNDPSLRQLKQRVVLRCSLAPLDLASTAAYIATRLEVAGGTAGQLFTRDAVRTIYQVSAGIPRTIGVVCENALLAGYAAQKKPVDRLTVVEVCRDLDLPLDGAARAPAPTFRETSFAVAKPAASAQVAPQPAAPGSWSWLRRTASRTRSRSDAEPGGDSLAAVPAVPDRRIFKFF